MKYIYLNEMSCCKQTELLKPIEISQFEVNPFTLENKTSEID